jgi:hypothetical protein
MKPLMSCVCGLSLTISLCLLLEGCEGNECGGGAAGSSDVCPPPTYGYGAVEGRAIRNDGTPFVGYQVYVNCGEVMGGIDDLTDHDGRFAMRLSYAVFDTLLYPFPPRNADRSFDLSCGINLRPVGQSAILLDSLLVRFTPDRAAVVPASVELRERAS